LFDYWNDEIKDCMGGAYKKKMKMRNVYKIVIVTPEWKTL
jgi:hypothetical protein